MLKKFFRVLLVLGIVTVPQVPVLATPCAETSVGEWSAQVLERMGRDIPGIKASSSGGARYSALGWTYLAGRRREQASGLMVMPQGRLRGIVVYLPGSNFERAKAPSRPDRIDGEWEAAVFAGSGYTLLVPDYPGLGATVRPQAFTLLEPNLRAIRAMLSSCQTAFAAAGREVPLFIIGFSQGGQLAVALHHSLESAPIAGLDLRGTVSVAGPLNLEELLRSRLQPPHDTQAMGMMLLAGAVYAHSVEAEVPLAKVFAPRFVQLVPRWADGAHSPEAIFPELPKTAAALFSAAFVSGFQTNRRSWFKRSLDQNSPKVWRVRRPLLLVAGAGDEIVGPEVVALWYGQARARGGTVGYLLLPSKDHQSTMALAYAPALALFQRLSR